MTLRTWAAACLCLMLCGCSLQPAPTELSAPPENSIPTAPVSPAEPSVSPDAPDSPPATDPRAPDESLFAPVWEDAARILETLPLSEQIGQMLLARCPSEEALSIISNFHPGGFVLFRNDFEGKSRDEVIAALASYQSASSVPMLMAVDEEGGTVVRVSANRQLIGHTFSSPQALFAQGGMGAIVADTQEKSQFLLGLGLQVNLAPVADVSIGKNDFIYKRAFGQPAPETAGYVSAVVSTMNEENIGCALKHFPGYGDNADSHTGIVVDDRPYAQFQQSDFLPFKAGIEAGAGCVLVAHNIVTCIDAENPASLSPAVHRVLREELGFSGVILTDDLSMDAITDRRSDVNPVVAAALAGNDLLLVDDVPAAVEVLTQAVEEGMLPRGTVEQAAQRVLVWKITLGLM